MYEPNEPHDEWGKPIPEPKQIICETCSFPHNIYHFDWYSITCQGCGEEIVNKFADSNGSYEINENEKDLITMALLDFEIKEEEKPTVRELMKKLWKR